MLQRRRFSEIALLLAILGTLLFSAETGCAGSTKRGNAVGSIQHGPQSEPQSEACWPEEFQNNNKKTGDYPDLAKVDCGKELEQSLRSRRITVKLCIDESGNVVRAVVLKSLCPEADKALCEAMSKWQFEPYLADGKAVPSVCVLTVTIN